jgi:hypothetical protein
MAPVSSRNSVATHCKGLPVSANFEHLDEGTFYEGHGRHLWFDVEKGHLIVNGSWWVRLFKLGPPPSVMVKQEGIRGWRRDRGDGKFDLAKAIREVAAYEAAQAGARERGEWHLRPLNTRLEILGRFVERIPGPVRDEVALYPERSWQLFSYLSCCGDPALELAHTRGRALGFMIANAWVFAEHRVQWEMRRCRSLLRRKRWEAAGALQFPPTKPVVKVLSRVVSAALSIPAMLYLRGALSDPAILKRLGHVPRINRGCIGVVSDARLLPHCSQSLLVEVGAGPYFEGSILSLRRTFHDTLDLLADRGGRLPTFRSLAQLYTLHDELGLEARRRKPRQRVVFPPEPLPSIPGRIE